MKLIWAQSAIDDLDAIREYISQDSPPAACRVLGEIRTGVIDALQHPKAGRPGRVEGTREIVLTKLPYTMPYRLNGDRVEILRVYHQSRKWPDEL